MRILKLTTTNHQEIIDQTIKTLKKGGLVVFPSDTVYGLLVDSTNPTAVDKLLAFKDRPVGKAISVFVADEKMAEEYVVLNQNAKNIIKNLLPGPFTVICESRQPSKTSSGKAVDSRLLAENGTLGFRIPDFSLITELVTKFGRPVTATSANLSGTPPHYSIESFLLSSRARSKTTSRGIPSSPNKEIPPCASLSRNDRRIDLISLVVDAGKLPFNKPSTVIDTTTGQLKTLRIGDLLPNTPNSLITKSENETQKLARFLATKFVKKYLGKPIVFLLEGNLGAGKTIFAKGLGKALGVKENITSPTFPISIEYKIDNFNNFNNNDNNSIFNDNSDIVCNKKTASNTLIIRSNLFIHYDLYRIDSAEELKEINFFESFSCGNIYAIEWPERMSAEIISALQNVAEIVYIKIKSVSENERPSSTKVTEGLREIEWSSIIP